MAAMSVRDVGPCGARVGGQCSAAMPPAEVRVGEAGWALPRPFLARLPTIRDLEVRPDDVWVLSYPKCGTTWTQEMVWVLSHDCDLQAARAAPLYQRFPFLDFAALTHDGVVPNTIEIVKNLPRDKPRFIKSHLPISLLPKALFTVKPKVIYVARDPRDAVVSYFHHYRLWNGFRGPFEDFLDAFLEDEVLYSPFLRHVSEFWSLRDEHNFLFLTYEDMKKDLGGELRRTARFLGRELSPEQEAAAVQHLSFASMKANPAVNLEEYTRPVRQENPADADLCFIRQGEAGAWKKALTPEQAQRMQRWVQADEHSHLPWRLG